MLEYNNDVRNVWHDSHEQHDVRVSEYALHNDFILNFSKKIVSHLRVENLLNSDGSAVESSFVNHGEATLADLLP